MSQLAVFGALFAGLAVGSTVWVVVQPYRRLAPRLRPYASVSRGRLARSVDVRGQAGAAVGESTLHRLFGPIFESAVSSFAQLLGAGNDEALGLKLRQAGMYPGLPMSQKVREYKVRSLGRSLLFMCAGGGLGLLASGPRAMVLLGIGGLVYGVLFSRSRLDGAVKARRERLRAELYTFNQIIAMRTRVGGGVTDALRHTVARGNGVFVDDIAEVLRLQASGVSLSAALQRAARLSLEPEAQRTFSVLATAQDRGADLGDALLDLSKDLRSQRRDDLQREAARRRLLLIVPIVIILAPVMLLFIGAPLPSLIFGTAP